MPSWGQITLNGVTLDAHIVSGKSISFNIDRITRSFFTACNRIFGNCLHATEIIQLTLRESYYLPVMTYAVPAISFKSKQVSGLELSFVESLFSVK
jgi:hypothetical protein